MTDHLAINEDKSIARSRKRHDDKMIQEPLIDIEDNLKGDRGNVALLLFLYLLQGIPLGLSAAVPMLLQNRGVSYKQQAEFSFAFWPFSIKLLWAPIVDSLYVKRFGRRKTWLIPIQYLLGLFMIFLSFNIDTWLAYNNGEDSPHIGVLAICFFILNMLAATQDIAVDGWALTMLKRENVGHASTCNSVGQTAGYFLGYVIFMALESPDFGNTYIRTVPQSCGLVTLAGFLYFWGIVFLVVTTLVGMFKRENDSYHAASETVDITDTYKQLWQIIKLPSIQTLAIVLLTCKVAFSACDAVTSLKLIDAGVPKDKFAMMAVLLVPLDIVMPIVLSKYTAGKKPMDIYVKAIPYRLSFNIAAAVFVYFTPYIIKDSNIPFYYYIMLFLTSFFHQITLYSMFVSSMGFFARISDPAFGGTYMTLLNTLSNLGGNWPTTLALYCVENLTWKTCSSTETNNCMSPESIKECETSGGSCSTLLDGYYLETVLCTVFGYFWLVSWGRRTILNLQNKKESSWKVQVSQR